MHLDYLGIMKKLLDYWTINANTKLDKTNILQISSRLSKHIRSRYKPLEQLVSQIANEIDDNDQTTINSYNTQIVTELKDDENTRIKKIVHKGYRLTTNEPSNVVQL